MAKKRNGFAELADTLEGAVFFAFKKGLQASANAVVRDLQKVGPTWTGEFQNSWEIATSSKVSSGSGAAGPAETIKAPLLTNDEFKFKPEIKYYIANKSKHADIALDIVPYVKELDEDVKFGKPRGNKPIKYGTRPEGGRRGELEGSGSNRSTAPLDWYVTYLRAGNLDKTISLYMDQALRGIKK